MTRPNAKGWCPGAYHPMMSGDGLVVRVRPVLARLEQSQVLGICAAAQDFGSGIIDLTSRANLQIRGVQKQNHNALLQRLNSLDLVPDDPALESRRNFLISPFWKKGDLTHRLAQALTARLCEMPKLPPKVGFAIDTGTAPMFLNDSADFRLERTPSGELLVRADGMTRGHIVAEDEAINALIEMAHWFNENRTDTLKRMAPLTAKKVLPVQWQGTLRAAPASELTPGMHELGAVYGAAFGKIEASRLSNLISSTGANAMRITPWRLFIFEGADLTDTTDFITGVADPLLRVDACPGAPLCETATVKTRGLARELAPFVKRDLHVSGCAKGCARPRRCAVTLVGNAGTFDLVHDGAPWDEPVQTGMMPGTLKDCIGEN
ncbi:cobalamin biosynthesis protein CobG [Pseudopelagicola sp. nBUS_19]|uniref:cobalamin biosynthesis protein CobG n=1 Tax=Pseudopelagicola sp. nBUS_19 TaxID=3395316 RepID=UPI003EBE2F71